MIAEARGGPQRPKLKKTLRLRWGNGFGFKIF